MVARAALGSALLLAFAGSVSAQCTPAAGRFPLLSRLNQPFVPGVPSLPGVATPSPLGLLAPRLSMLDRFSAQGGFAGPNAGVTLTGVALPRLAPVANVLTNGLPNPGDGLTTAVGVISPRLGVGVQILQESRRRGGGLFRGRGCP